MQLNVKLNDFDGFDQLLFNQRELNLTEKIRWKKYYDMKKNAVFIPIPKNPETIEEYQFCHYVYWMTIFGNGLFKKPAIFRKFMKEEVPLRPIAMCFACEFDERYNKQSNCPIKVWKPCKCTQIAIGEKGDGFQLFGIIGIFHINPAYIIAHYEWSKD